MIKDKIMHGMPTSDEIIRIFSAKRAPLLWIDISYIGDGYESTSVTARIEHDRLYLRSDDCEVPSGDGSAWLSELLSNDLLDCLVIYGLPFDGSFEPIRSLKNRCGYRQRIAVKNEWASVVITWVPEEDTWYCISKEVRK